MTVHFEDLTLDWLGYATLRVEADDTVIYFDPGRYGVLTGEWEPHVEGINHPPAQDYRAQDGDLVLVTHIHHYDPDGIRRVASEDATVVLFEGINVHETDRDVDRPVDLDHEVVEVGMEDELVAADCPVWTVPAYNEEDGPNLNDDGTPIHPKGIGCGFMVEIGGERVFWPGDSDVLPGHEELDVDVFAPSIAKNYTMDRFEAAELAASMAPDLVLPIHYNTFESLEGDGEAFAVDVSSRHVPVVLDH